MMWYVVELYSMANFTYPDLRYWVPRECVYPPTSCSSGVADQDVDNPI